MDTKLSSWLTIGGASGEISRQWSTIYQDIPTNYADVFTLGKNIKTSRFACRIFVRTAGKHKNRLSPTSSTSSHERGESTGFNVALDVM